MLFANPSDIPGSASVFSNLRDQLECGTMRFARTTRTDEEIRTLDETGAAPGRVLPARAYAGRDDIRRHRYRPVTNPFNRPLRRTVRGPKTPKWVLDSDIEEEEEKLAVRGHATSRGDGGEESDPIESWSD